MKEYRVDNLGVQYLIPNDGETEEELDFAIDCFLDATYYTLCEFSPDVERLRTADDIVCLIRVDDEKRLTFNIEEGARYVGAILRDETFQIELLDEVGAQAWRVEWLECVGEA